MSAADLVATTVAQSGWQSVYSKPELTVVEISDGLQSGRTQFVEIAFTPGLITRYGAGTIPAMLQVRTRVMKRTGNHYDHDEADSLNCMAILSNDFQPFGIARIHPYYYVSCTTILDGLTPAVLMDLVLAAAAVGDQFELNLSAGGLDEF